MSLSISTTRWLCEIFKAYRELRNTNGRVSVARPGIFVVEVYIHSIDMILYHWPSWWVARPVGKYKTRHPLPCGE